MKRPNFSWKTDPRVLATACYIGLLASLVSPLPASAESFEITRATIADINKAFDAGALNSEQLVRISLQRIAAFDDAGPVINAVMLLNSQALERAKALDAERDASGRRSPLHGIPIVLKDNFDTADMPTTAGSFMLKGSMPPDDAFLVRQLRDAGAIVLAKLNMSEFASGDAMNSLDGPTFNPHDPTRTPSGSSGGTGASIAAAYAFVGLGTDTGGSVRGPSSANGIVGLKPTHGLLSRDGIVPLALSFDTAGPMTRSVYDVAVVLGVTTGIDEADAATSKSDGRFQKEYTQYLDENALNGARIGIARDFMGKDREVDWVIEAAIEVMRDSGAEIVDVEFPEWLLESRGEFYRAIPS
ncbi:MAG: amidase family protein, partial [Woeseiaceae bacterium]